MDQSCLSAGGKVTVCSIRRTYNSVQQIAKNLRVDEQDEDLKAFYAKLIVYCTIIESHLISIRGNDRSLITLLLAPLKQTFTPKFYSFSSDDWVRELARIHDRIRTIKDNDTKIDIIQPCLNFGTTPDTRREVTNSLDSCEEELRVKYPEDSSHWATEDLAPQLKISEPNYGVWKAAQSIFTALTACVDCPCTPTHGLGARLCLATYRKPQFANEEEDIDFNMFLSTKRDWQEVLVHTSRDRLVRVVVEEPNDTKPKPRYLSAGRTQKVKNLCEPIAKIEPRRSYRLVFKVTKNELFKLQSERSVSPIDRSQSAISLDEFLRGRPGSFTEKTKRILAVILSSAVFHLHKTPWLHSDWNSSDVLFFRTSSSAIPLRPFIHTRLPNAANESGLIHQSSLNIKDIDPDDIDPDDLLNHNCPSLVTLAMMLLEVYFGVPFNILAQKFNVELESGAQPSAFTRYMDVDYVFKACRKDIPQNSQFYIAVENCLDPQIWQDEEGNELQDSDLRVKIYTEVVLPLETELSQAYRDIRIEELDRFAQDLDFGSWGQPLFLKNQQINAGNVQENAMLPITQYSDNLTVRQKPTDDETVDREAQRASPLNKRRLDLSPSRSETGSPFSEIPDMPNIYPRSSYTVGILCALPLELLAVRALFDTTHENRHHIRGDSNTYALGTINEHIVVAACLPSGEYGTNAAADSASNMKRTFPNIEFCLLVGIGGGAPTQENDIRLGDVVEVEGNTFELTGSLHPPPRCLLTAISALRSDPDLPIDALQSSLDTITGRVPDYGLDYRAKDAKDEALYYTESDWLRSMSVNCVLKKQTCLYMPQVPLRELFQAGYGFGPFPKNPDDCFVPITQDPNLLQNTLLISGLHYSRNMGDLSVFEPTFLFHKIQSIRKVNRWLEGATDNKSQILCAKYISTLAISEGCLGNFEVAESHFNGLMVYLESRRLEMGQDVKSQVEAELITRYLIMTYNVVHCITSRISDLIATQCASRGLEARTDPKTYGVMKPLRMLPFFFGFVPTERKPKDVDMRMTITALRDITRRANPSHTKASADTNWKVWSSVDTPRLLFALEDAHIESFSDKLQLPPQGRQTYISSWSAFCVAMSMYLTSVVELWNHGLPIEGRLRYYIIRVLEDDIRNGYETFEHMNQDTRYTWFWKAFVGSLSVVQAQSVNYDERLDDIFANFSKYVKKLTKAEKISSWEEAKKILVTVVWPVECTQDEMCKKVLARLLGKE
ncbi:hypothetical protein F53441_5954 [Fusarium austroafricanum]|uniref:DUF7580 domain-containing protein n=1 Tax=Fusarium austroafricanum TaxID=2364996 RepID=A0A8H4P7N3_9HYPO|nr:hypothetical protein F53441_5954 [Fusarium austroafricanum]